MPQRPPARVGDPASAIDTPALVLDLDPFERNLDLMASAVRGAGLALRPHAKAHKCPEIARRQLERGAVGICCQKVDEAAAFVDAGIRDVLVTNEVVADAKLARLAALARRATVGVLADDAATVARIGRAARAAGVTLDVLVEVDVGAHRCGVAPGAPAAGARRRDRARRRAAAARHPRLPRRARSTCARRPSARPRSPPPRRSRRSRRRRSRRPASPARW